LILCAVCLPLVATSARAEEEPTFEVFTILPRHYENAELLRVARAAFAGRGWTLIDATDDTVVGRIEHKKVDATLALKAQNDRFLYTIAGTKRVTRRKYISGRSSKKIVIAEEFVPTRWLDNIRIDIVRSLEREEKAAAQKQQSQRAEDRQPLEPDSESASERLRTIEDLFSQGLITREEYDAKRSEVLSEL
jgi:hypothetical protein